MNNIILNDALKLYDNINSNCTAENLISLHKSFLVEDKYTKIKNIHFCRFKNTRREIYRSIEKICKNTAEKEYPHLIKTGNDGNSCGGIK